MRHRNTPLSRSNKFLFRRKKYIKAVLYLLSFAIKPFPKVRVSIYCRSSFEMTDGPFELSMSFHEMMKINFPNYNFCQLRPELRWKHRILVYRPQFFKFIEKKHNIGDGLLFFIEFSEISNTVNGYKMLRIKLGEKFIKAKRCNPKVINKIV